jgi:hypothetical protein
MISFGFLKAVLIVSVAAFVFSLAVYSNPWARGMYEKSTKTGIIKTWKNNGKFLLLMYLITILEILMFSWIFSIITIHTGTDWLNAGVYFGLFLCLIRVIPRGLDMFMMVNYPKRLLALELFNGCLISFVMAIGISYFLY